MDGIIGCPFPLRFYWHIFKWLYKQIFILIEFNKIESILMTIIDFQTVADEMLIFLSCTTLPPTKCIGNDNIQFYYTHRGKKDCFYIEHINIWKLIMMPEKRNGSFFTSWIYKPTAITKTDFYSWIAFNAVNGKLFTLNDNDLLSCCFGTKFYRILH